MPEYDFDTLSPLEFERLVRDLLQRRESIALESFGTGPDGGIDLRLATPKHANAIVVQCKHYARSTVSQLMGVLRREEKPKVEKLKPERYILVTSLTLPDTRRGEVRDLFAPFCRSTADVVTREELNNWLGQFPDVELHHPKLWLTSLPVLQRVLHAGVFEAAEDELSRVRSSLEKLVIHDGVARAREILEREHLCVLMGKPGAGKTTLARLLLIDYHERDAFEVVPLIHGIGDLANRRRRGRKQIYFIDDFLGRTNFDGLSRNEDQRIVDFIHEVKKEPEWRLVLTTREYVLATARQRSEPLRYLPFEPNACVVEPRTFTEPARAEILYQHLYWSDVPHPHLVALLRSGKHQDVIKHRNYNPRVIEHLTSAIRVGAVPADRYPDLFIETLDNPEQVWDLAFHHGIDEDARDVLAVMATLPSGVRIDDLETCWRAFQRARAQQSGPPVSTRPFDRVLQPLIGTFLTTESLDAQGGARFITVSFENPSAGDFLENYLARQDHLVGQLVKGAVALQQLRALWRGLRDVPYRGLTTHRDALAVALERLIPRDDHEVHGGHWFFAGEHWSAPEVRAILALDIADAFKSKRVTDLARNALTIARSGWERNPSSVDVSSVTALLLRLFKQQPSEASQRPPTAALREAALLTLGRDCIIESMYWADDVSSFIRLARELPGSIDPDSLERAETAFARCADNEMTATASNHSAAHWFSLLDQLQEQAEFFGFDASEESFDDNRYRVHEAYEHAAARGEIQYKREQEEDERREAAANAHTGSGIAAISGESSHNPGAPTSASESDSMTLRFTGLLARLESMGSAV